MGEPIFDLIYVLDSMVTIILKIGAMSVILHYLTHQ